METEQELARIREGDLQAFRRLYDRYQSAVMGVGYSILGDWARAEDVCQETFLRVHQSLASYRPGTNFRGWILNIAHNCAIDGLRKARREVALPGDVTAPARDLDARKAFEDLLRPLQSQEKLVVTLKYREDLPYRDIAQITGKAEGSLRNLVSAALKKLKGSLGITSGAAQERTP